MADTTGVQPLARLQPPAPSLSHSAHPAAHPPAEGTACACPWPVCCPAPSLRPAGCPAHCAQQVSSAGPCSATILSGLESHWKLRGHSPHPLAKHRSAPTATWTSLFSFPNPLHYNNLLTYLSVTLLWAKDNSFPSPKSSALIQVLNLNSSDPHL